MSVIKDVLSTIADKAKEDGLDLKVEKGRLIPGKEEHYFLIKSEEVGFTNNKKCTDCGEEVERICRVVYVEEGAKDYGFKDLCDSCYAEKYQAEQAHSCQNTCPSCNCKEEV